jgi:hypothetical protein
MSIPASDVLVAIDPLQSVASLTMTGNSVGTTGGTLLAASSATKSITVQNTHATQSLYVSTTSPASASNGIVLAAGVGYQFPFIPSNTLYCTGSGANTTYTLWYA